MGILGKIARKLSGGADIVRAFMKGSERVDGLEVYGCQEFRRGVIKALLLLRDKELPAWNTLNRHVGSILEGRRTIAVVTAHPAFMFLDGPHSSQDPEFLAGTISYMACSCELHRTHEAEFPGHRVPRDIYSGSAAQERCEKAYRECLLALGKLPEKTDSQKGPDAR